MAQLTRPEGYPEGPGVLDPAAAALVMSLLEAEVGGEAAAQQLLGSSMTVLAVLAREEDWALTRLGEKERGGLWRRLLKALEEEGLGEVGEWVRAAALRVRRGEELVDGLVQLMREAAKRSEGRGMLTALEMAQYARAEGRGAQWGRLVLPLLELLKRTLKAQEQAMQQEERQESSQTTGWSVRYHLYVCGLKSELTILSLVGRWRLPDAPHSRDFTGPGARPSRLAQLRRGSHPPGP